MAEQQIYEVIADQNGNWEVNLPNTFGDGVHAVTAVDQEGNKDAVVVDIRPEQQVKTIVEEKVVTKEVAKEVMPQGLFLWVTLLYLIAMFVSLGMIYFSKRVKNEDGSPSRAKTAGITAGVLVMVLASVLYVYASISFGIIKSVVLQNINWQAAFSSMAKPSAVEPKYISVSGIVSDPRTRQGVEGVSISAEGTVVKTQADGSFAIGSVNDGLGVRIDYTTLNRPLRYKVKEGRQELIFDASLYNAAIAMMDYEAHNKIDSIYFELLNSKTQEKISLDGFVKSYQKNFNKLNDAMSELIVLDFKLWQDWLSPEFSTKHALVAEMVLGNGQGGQATYYFAFENGSWKLVK